jgi:hypothetical protein
MNETNQNGSNETNENTLSCRDTKFHLIVFYYLNILITVPTITTIIVCICVFYRIIKNDQNSGQMFKYLIASSTFELVLFVMISFEVGYYCKSCGVSYLWKMWYVWFYVYLYYGFVTISNYLEVAAQLDCYIMIKFRLKFVQTNKFFVFVLLVLLVLSLIPNLQNVYLFEIMKSESIQLNKSIYSIKITNYYFTNVYQGLNYTLAFHREVLPLILLVAFNTLILITLLYYEHPLLCIISSFFLKDLTFFMVVITFK